MRRVIRGGPRGAAARAVALAIALADATSACGPNARASAHDPAAQRLDPNVAADATPATRASEWTGVHRDPPPVDTPAPLAGPGTWVLHVGDSFAHAFFQQNLAPRFRATGSRYIVDATTATYTTTWANDPGFDAWLARKPALVVVTLGANEFDIPFPAVHAQAIETIARKIAASGAACVWTTPPSWTRDTGILQVIHDHCGPCAFFDSDALLSGGLGPAERSRDHIHPNERGGLRWATAFWGWLLEHRDPTRGPWAIVPFERRSRDD